MKIQAALTGRRKVGIEMRNKCIQTKSMLQKHGCASPYDGGIDVILIQSPINLSNRPRGPSHSQPHRGCLRAMAVEVRMLTTPLCKAKRWRV